MGRMMDRVQRELTPEDIAKIAGTYHAWRGDPPSPELRRAGNGAAKYKDIAGFCKSASLDDMRAHGHVLTPGRYVGAGEVENDGEPFEQKMKRLSDRLEEQFGASAKLEKAIRANLEGLGYGR
jgi:type I restriction enzyme M protein